MSERQALTVILDEVGKTSPTGLSRYATELTKALIASAPAGVDVAGFSPAIKEDRAERIGELLPGLASLQQAALPAREMREAWLHSLTTLSLPGLVHSPSLFAPMRADYDDTAQTVVTVHGLGGLSDRSARKTKWFERALRRAHKYAAGVVVPTHAIAAELSEQYDFGDRIRVIAAGVPSGLAVPQDAAERAERLALPSEYVMTMTTSSSRGSGARIIDTLSNPTMPDVPVVLVGPVAWGDVTVAEQAVAAGIAAGRIIVTGELDDDDLAVVYDRASAFLYPNANDGFCMPLLEAFALGTPVVHLATPSLHEIAGDATIAVDAEGDLAENLALGVSRLLSDAGLAKQLTLLGRDEVRAYDWQTSAQQIWQFHADV